MENWPIYLKNLTLDLKLLKVSLTLFHQGEDNRTRRAQAMEDSDFRVNQMCCQPRYILGERPDPLLFDHNILP